MQIMSGLFFLSKTVLRRFNVLTYQRRNASHG